MIAYKSDCSLNFHLIIDYGVKKTEFLLISQH